MEEHYSRANDDTGVGNSVADSLDVWQVLDNVRELSMQRQFTEALRLIHRARALEPEREETPFLEAWIYFVQGRSDTAIATLTDAQHFLRDEAYRALAQGKIAFYGDDVFGCIEPLRSARKLFAGSHAVGNIDSHLAAAYLACKEYGEAITSARSAIAAADSRPQNFMIAGWAEYLRGNCAASRDYFDEAIKAAPQDMTYYRIYFQLMLRRGWFRTAWRVLKTAVRYLAWNEETLNTAKRTDSSVGDLT